MSTLSRILLLSALSVFMSGCFLKDLIFLTGPKCEDADVRGQEDSWGETDGWAGPSSVEPASIRGRPSRTNS
jgi:hypothetical protein